MSEQIRGGNYLTPTDYAIVTAYFVTFHIFYYLVIYYSGDDHLVLQASFAGTSQMYHFYGKPELAYFFEAIKTTNNVSPLLLRTIILASSLIYVLLFLNIIHKEIQDRFASTAAALFLSSSFIWSINLFAINYAYLCSMLILALFARLVQDSLDRERFGWGHAAGMLLLGGAGVSYEPLVIFMPLLLTALLWWRNLGFRQLRHAAYLRRLGLFTVLAVLVQLTWYKLTPASGLYAGVNPASMRSILITIPELPLYVYKFTTSAIAEYLTDFRKIGPVQLSMCAGLFGGMLFYLWHLLRTAGSPVMQRGFAIFLFGFAFIALGLLPFIVAQKVDLETVSNLANPFENRHYLLAATGLAVVVCGAAVIARRSAASGLLFAAVISFLVVGGFNSFQHLYYGVAGRAMLTAGVVNAAVKDTRALAAKTIVIDPVVSTGGKKMATMLGWYFWGPGYLWRQYGGDPSKLVVPNLTPISVNAVYNTVVSGFFWYGYPHIVSKKQPMVCLVASTNRPLSRTDVRQLFWSYYTDRSAFFRDLSVRIALKQYDCPPIPELRDRSPEV